MPRRDEYTPVAEGVPFDNDSNGFVADDVQGAIEEVNNAVTTSASPGFSFGRSGNSNPGTWLLCESVPCNRTGRRVYISDAKIRKLYTNSQRLDTYTIAIYYHDGNGINLTLVSSHNVVAARGATFTLSASVPTGKQLALRIISGRARNIVAGLELSGTN